MHHTLLIFFYYIISHSIFFISYVLIMFFFKDIDITISIFLKIENRFIILFKDFNINNIYTPLYRFNNL